MNSTALGAENTKKQEIIFISEAHEKFYYEKLKEVRYQDVYHKALCYCLGISDDNLPRDANGGKDEKNAASGHNVQKSQADAEKAFLKENSFMQEEQPGGF